jgi:hypothetical protein
VVNLRWSELDRAVIAAQPVSRIARVTTSALSFEMKPGQLVQAE